MPVKTARIETFEDLAKSDYHIFAESGRAPLNSLIQANTTWTNQVFEMWQTQEDRGYTERPGEEIEIGKQ